MKTKAVLVNDTSLHENHIGCDCVAESITQGLLDHGVVTTHRVPLRTHWNTPETVAEMRNANIIIVNGEGCVHSSRPWVKEMLRVAEFANHIKTPIALVNTVYQNNDTETASLVGRFDLRTVRESLSQKELANAGVKSEVVPDLSFYKLGKLRKAGVWPKLQSTMRPSRYTLVTDSVDPNTSKGVRQTLNNRLASNILIHKAQISQSRRIRYRASVALGLRRNNRTYCPWTPAEAFSYIRHAKFLFSGRFHYTCFAIAAGCPFSATPSNSHKIEGMLLDAGLSARLAEPTEATNCEALLKSWSSSDTFACDQYSNHAFNRINELFRDIAQIAFNHTAHASAL